MNRKIKLIWDMHGPHAQGTAEHHAIHLKEYVDKENMDCHETGAENFSPMHSIAYMIVNESDMIKVRDVLLPQRAEEAE